MESLGNFFHSSQWFTLTDISCKRLRYDPKASSEVPGSSQSPLSARFVSPPTQCGDEKEPRSVAVIEL